MNFYWIYKRNKTSLKLSSLCSTEERTDVRVRKTVHFGVNCLIKRPNTMNFVSLCLYAEEQQKYINKRDGFCLFYCMVALNALNALRPANWRELFPQAAPGGPSRSPDSAPQINALVFRSCCLKTLQNPMNCMKPVRDFSSAKKHSWAEESSQHRSFLQCVCYSDVKAPLEEQHGMFSLKLISVWLRWKGWCCWNCFS